MGSRSDQVSAAEAPKYLCEAVADAISADAESATDFGFPLDPLVGTTTAQSSGTDVKVDSPKESAGPTPSIAAARASRCCGMDHSGRTLTKGRSDDLSMMTVG